MFQQFWVKIILGEALQGWTVYRKRGCRRYKEYMAGKNDIHHSWFFNITFVV
jgi:hypothetical protein